MAPATTKFHAALQVLGTYEILEMIMLLLPEKDILLSQRTTKVWAIMVKRSQKLQEKLYLKSQSIAITSDGRLAELETVQSTQSANCLLAPLLCKIRRHSEIFTHEGELTLPTSWAYPEASWRKMHFTHPVVCDKTISINYDVPEIVEEDIFYYSYTKIITFVKLEELTAGNIVEAACEFQIEGGLLGRSPLTLEVFECATDVHMKGT